MKGGGDEPFEGLLWVERGVGDPRGVVFRVLDGEVGAVLLVEHGV